jgi:hypothetical protein
MDPRESVEPKMEGEHWRTQGWEGEPENEREEEEERIRPWALRGKIFSFPL